MWDIQLKQLNERKKKKKRKLIRKKENHNHIFSIEYLYEFLIRFSLLFHFCLSLICSLFTL